MILKKKPNLFTSFDIMTNFSPVTLNGSGISCLIFPFAQWMDKQTTVDK